MVALATGSTVAMSVLELCMTLPFDRRLLDLLEIEWPIIQAPMAGVSTPAMASAVSNAGGLSSSATARHLRFV
jgi:hypothetical protein